MLKIGFVDYYLDNWHANNYPGFLRDVIAEFGFDARITHAFGMNVSPNGTTNTQWCTQQNMSECNSMQELIDSVDAIVVIAADNSSWHNEVCQLPLMSSKPVFVDKTFAHNIATAKKLFDLAKRYNTPVFSSSAQRFCQSIVDYKEKHTQKPNFVSTVGPHSLENYAVHQLEPIVALMGTGVKRIKAFCVGTAVTQLILDYGDGRLASFLLSPQPYAEFNFMVSDGECGQRLISDDGNFYHNLALAILNFFTHGINPVQMEETLEIIAIIQTAQAARTQPDTWLTVEY